MPWLELLGGAVVGLILEYVFKLIINRFSIYKEVKENNNIDLSGSWFAAWQTTINNQDTITTEPISVKQKGGKVHVKNTEPADDTDEGAYLWESNMRFSNGKYLMGMYYPCKGENITSKGTMYIVYDSHRKVFVGKWIGTGYDGDLESGYLIFAESREKAKNSLEEITSNTHDVVRIISKKMLLGSTKKQG